MQYTSKLHYYKQLNWYSTYQPCFYWSLISFWSCKISATVGNVCLHSALWPPDLDNTCCKRNIRATPCCFTSSSSWSFLWHTDTAAQQTQQLQISIFKLTNLYHPWHHPIPHIDIGTQFQTWKFNCSHCDIGYRAKFPQLSCYPFISQWQWFTSNLARNKTSIALFNILK